MKPFFGFGNWLVSLMVGIFLWRLTSYTQEILTNFALAVSSQDFLALFCFFLMFTSRLREQNECQIANFSHSGRHVITYIFNDLCTNFNMSKYKMLFIYYFWEKHFWIKSQNSKIQKWPNVSWACFSKNLPVEVPLDPEVLPSVVGS